MAKQSMTQPSAASGLTPTPTKTANYTAVKGDLVPVDATAGGITVTLPASPTAGDSVGVYKTDVSANVVTIAGTIDGATNATIVTQNAGGTFEYIGASGWKLVSTYSTVGPAGPTGPTGPPGAGGYFGKYTPGLIGGWYPASAFGDTSGLSTRTIPAGTLIVGTPYIPQETITIDAIGCYLQTASTAGGLLRLGVWQVTGANPFNITLSSAYATLLVDAGTVASDAGGGAPKTITLGTPLVVTAGTAFVIGVAAQVQSAIVYHESLSNAWWSPWGSGTILSGPNGNIAVTGVTAALPATLTPAAFGALAVGAPGWFHRSA